jgi:hypothetical protein
MLQYVKLQTDPEVIYLSATADAALVEAAGAEVPGARGAGRVSGYAVRLERSAVFAYDKASGPVLLGSLGRGMQAGPHACRGLCPHLCPV